jgi:hypothetical protein
LDVENQRNKSSSTVEIVGRRGQATLGSANIVERTKPYPKSRRRRRYSTGTFNHLDATISSRSSWAWASYARRNQRFGMYRKP